MAKKKLYYIIVYYHCIIHTIFVLPFFYCSILWKNYINRINHIYRTYLRGTRRKNIAVKCHFKVATWTRRIIRRRYRRLSSVFTWRGFDGPTSFWISFMMRKTVTFSRGKRFEPSLLSSINFNFVLLSTFFQTDDFIFFFQRRIWFARFSGNGHCTSMFGRNRFFAESM